MLGHNNSGLNNQEDLSNHNFKKHSFKTRDYVCDSEGAVATHHVYLVDDSEDDRYFTSNALQNSDKVHDIQSLGSAQDLLAHLEMNGAYHSVLGENNLTPIILLDIHMPKLCGIETLRSLRQHPLTSDFAVVLLTGSPSSNNFYDAYMLKADGYLEKPLQIAQFDTVLESIEGGSEKMSVGYTEV